MKIAILALGAALALVTGCSTVNPASALPGSDLRELKSAYVVAHGGRSEDMDLHIEDALIRRGIRVRSSPDTAIPKDVDFYVTYDDAWRWDLTMYLKELHIHFYDARSGTLLASGSFSNSLLHSFPDPGKKVSEVIATMYGEKPSG